MEVNLPLTKLTPIKTISLFGDSTYFKGIFGIRSWDNKFYIVDSESGRIVILDNNLDYLTTIGHRGRGPGELLFPVDISKNENRLFIADGGNKKIAVYKSEGDVFTYDFEFLSRFSGFRDPMCITILDTLIYNVEPNSKMPVDVISFIGESLYRFGRNVHIKAELCSFLQKNADFRD